MQLNGEKMRVFVFCVFFWPSLASLNLSRAIYDIFCQMPTLFFYNLYDGSWVDLLTDLKNMADRQESKGQIQKNICIGSPTNSYVIQRALALFNYIYYPKAGNSFLKFKYTH